MSEFDVDLDAPIKSEAERRGLTRDEAIAHGRRLAEDENLKLYARRPDYTKDQAHDRIRRAEAYAAWEYDGRLAGTIGKVTNVGAGTKQPAADNPDPHFRPDFK